MAFQISEELPGEALHYIFFRYDYIMKLIYLFFWKKIKLINFVFHTTTLYLRDLRINIETFSSLSV